MTRRDTAERLTAQREAIALAALRAIKVFADTGDPYRAMQGLAADVEAARDMGGK